MNQQLQNIRSVADFSPRNPNLSLVLVGMMGAGKTTIGRRLAARLNMAFIDADAEIEAAAGQTIADLFESYGEEAFRDGEKRVIARLLEERPRVIATGGGAFADPHTRRLALEKAIVIWLDADIETLLERTSRRTTRPLLNTGNPRETLQHLWVKRRPDYAKAHLHIKSGQGPHDKVVDAIVRALSADDANKIG